jgi:hypothetical protein
MACGCDSKMGCECILQGGDGISVSGIGTAGDPFIITNSRVQLGVADTPSLDLTVAGSLVSGKVRLAPLLGVADTQTVDMTLAGGGTEASPFVLSAAIKGLILSGGSTGSVLTQKPDGTWGPGPATQAPLGAVSTANGVKGDGSGGNPVRIGARTYAEWEAIVDASTF